MNVNEQKNVEMISKLIEQNENLEWELQLKTRETESLARNLEILQINFEDKKMSFKSEVHQILRKSDMSEEKDRIRCLVLEERVKDLEKELKELKDKYHMM